MSQTTAEAIRVSDEQIKGLAALGFEVENMEHVWGNEYRGNWRWKLYHPSKLDPIVDLPFLLNFGSIQHSEDAAWLEARRYAEGVSLDELHDTGD